MALTDGYVTDTSGGDWEYANTGGTGRGDTTGPGGQAWIRVENGGPIGGTQVKEDGSITVGPVVDFTDPAGLLSGAAEADGKRPWIVWAGVSPQSLAEVLIVWNKPVVVLNGQGITGGQVVSLTGRLMILSLEQPISISGREQKQIEIQPGAVGFYRDLDGPACDEQPEDTKQVENPGQLPEIPEYEPCGDCVTVQQGGGGGGAVAGAGGDPAAVTARVFCDMCNPDAQCGDFEGDTAAFVVNNGLSFPVRCCHPFVLVNVFNCDCPPTPCPPVPALVWQVCMDIFGTTEPMETLPLDQLFTINPCNASLTSWSNGYPAVLQTDVDCCGTAVVDIIGRYGTTATASGSWLGPLPGYRGQQVLYLPDCHTFCGQECVSIVKADWEDEYVAEDIIKPSQRSIPVSFFDSWFVTETSMTLPTDYTTTTVTAVTECLSLPLNLITEIQTTVVEFPTSIVTTQISIPGDLTEQVETINSPVTAVRDVVVSAAPAPTPVLNDLQLKSIDYVQSLTTNNAPVVQDLSYRDVTHVTDLQLTAPAAGVLSIPIDGVFDTFTPVGEVNFTAGDVVRWPTGQGSPLQVVTSCITAQQPILLDTGDPPVTVTAADGPVERLTLQNVGTTNVLIPTSFGTQPVTAISGQGGLVQSFTTVNLDIPTALNDQVITHFGATAGDILGITAISDGLITQITGLGSSPIYGFNQAFTAAEVGSPVTALTSISLGQTGVGVFPVDGFAVRTVEYAPIQGVSEFGQETATVASDPPAGAGWVTSVGTTQVVLCDSLGAEVTVNIVTDVQTAAAANLTQVYVTDMTLEGRIYADLVDLVSPVGANVFDTLSTGTTTFVAAQAGPTAQAFTAVTSVGTQTQPAVQTLEWYPVPAQTNTFLDGGAVQNVNLVQNLTTSPVTDVPINEVQDLTGDTFGVVTSLSEQTTNWAFSAEPGQEILTLPGNFQASTLTYLSTFGTVDLLRESSVPHNLEVFTDTWTLLAGQEVLDVTQLAVDIQLETIQVANGPVLGGVNEVQSFTAGSDSVATAGQTVTVTSYPPTTGQITEVQSIQASTFTIFQAGSLTTLNLPVEVQNDQLTAVKDFTQAIVNVVTECLTQENQLILPDGTDEVPVVITSDTGIKLLTETDPGCLVPYKFLNHPGADTYTIRVSNNPGCCDGEPFCFTQQQVLPWETKCETMVLLHGNYIDPVPLGNAEDCPCYDCTPDGPQITGDDATPADVGEPTGGLNPCTTRIQRVNRRFCKECNPSGG